MGWRNWLLVLITEKLIISNKREYRFSVTLAEMKDASNTEHWLFKLAYIKAPHTRSQGLSSSWWSEERPWERG